VRGTRGYVRGGVCVVGEFVLAYLGHFTVFICFWQDVVHTYGIFIHIFYRGSVKLWINLTPISPSNTLLVVENFFTLYSKT
jgi:hypothetical protein